MQNSRTWLHGLCHKSRRYWERVRNVTGPENRSLSLWNAWFIFLGRHNVIPTFGLRMPFRVVKKSFVSGTDYPQGKA